MIDILKPNIMIFILKHDVMIDILKPNKNCNSNQINSK